MDGCRIRGWEEEARHRNDIQEHYGHLSPTNRDSVSRAKWYFMVRGLICTLTYWLLVEVGKQESDTFLVPDHWPLDQRNPSVFSLLAER